MRRSRSGQDTIVCLQARQPSKYELKATSVLALPLTEVSAKVPSTRCRALPRHDLGPDLVRA